MKFEIVTLSKAFFSGRKFTNKKTFPISSEGFKNLKARKLFLSILQIKNRNT